MTGVYLKKAARSFDAAGMLPANEYGDFAASRAHYGCFYAARALLLYRDDPLNTCGYDQRERARRRRAVLDSTGYSKIPPGPGTALLFAL